MLVEKMGQGVDVEIRSIHLDALEYEFHKDVLYRDVDIFDSSLYVDCLAEDS